MDEIEIYSLDLAHILINKIITNYDPDARVNSKQGSSSPASILRISRVSFSVVQSEALEKEPNNIHQEDDLLAPDVILEQPNDSEEESEEDRDTSDSHSSIQMPKNFETRLPVEEERKRVVSASVLENQTLNTEAGDISHINTRLSEGNSGQDDLHDDITEGDMFFYSKINKTGMLYKKSSNIFHSWQKRYAVIKNTRFMYAKSQSAFDSKKEIRCINFITQQCRITDVIDNKFNIEIVGTKTKLKLKAENKREAEDWVGRLTKLSNYISIRDDQKIEYPVISEKKPWMIDSVTQEEFLETAQSGDILLFQTDNFLAKMQRKITGSDYDHVGIIFRFNTEVLFFDATGNNGVSMTSWDEFMRNHWNRFYSRISVRHLILEKPIQNLEDIVYEFIIETSGAQYNLNMSKFFKRTSAVRQGEADKDARKNEGYFCSELVAAAYKKFGLLNQRKSCSQYWPVSFSSKKKLKLLNGAQLSNEFQIMFEK